VICGHFPALRRHQESVSIILFRDVLEEGK